ncbi:hypothetical protein KK120_08875 [Virgibacillus dakarensis]|nr:hypothetical protein [Virgibacillus dakarensis]MBT2215935.1 hypothetical protein [Virgibacillus dakarensis]
MERKLNRNDDTLNTLTYGNAPILPEIGSEKYVILLEDLEFCMPKDQLKHITDLHNDGMWIDDIAEEVKRNPYEVLLALIHQVKRGYKMRPMAFRRNHEN